jgi:hypothetical protein
VSPKVKRSELLFTEGEAKRASLHQRFRFSSPSVTRERFIFDDSLLFTKGDKRETPSVTREREATPPP